MNKKSIITVCVILAVVLVCAGVAGVMYYNGGKLPAVTDTTRDGGNAPLNDEAIAAIKGENTGSEKVLPDDMLGVWVDLNTDITSTGTDAQVLYTEIMADFSYFTNFKCNTLYIQPDITGKTSGFTNSDGSSFDALACILSTAENKGILRVLVADEQLLGSGTPDFQNAIKILNSYPFDAVLINYPALAQAGNLSAFLAEAREKLDNSFPDVYLGCEMYALDGSSALYNTEHTAATEGKLSFVLVNADTQTTGNPSFTSVMNIRNAEAASNPAVRYYCMHRNDKVFTSLAGWEDYKEIVYQYKELWDFKSIKGSVFYKLAQLKKQRASSQRLSTMIYDGATENFEVQQMTLSPTENTVLFAGHYDTDRGLFCNNTAVTGIVGDKFSQTYQLATGDNTFLFENAGQYFTYRIYNNKDLIKGADCSFDGRNTLTINATCTTGSTVYAVFGGQIYNITPASDAGNGYSVYTGALDLSDFNYSSAVLDVVCTEGNGLKVYSVGTVDLTHASDYTAATQSKKVSPYSDNGLGTALMCEIYYNDTEQLGILDAHDTYDPDKSTLMKGTLDYVNQINFTEEGNLRYELKSGVAVYAENCRLINNAFVMPQNNITLTSVDDSLQNATNLYFNCDWLSPVTVTTAPNNYTSGYSSFSFNLSEFTAQYVDVKFAYTSTITGLEKLVCSADSVVASAEVLAGSDNESTILRLHLKKAGGFYGFMLSSDESGVLCLSLKKHVGSSVAGKIIMLDAGHGGLSMTGTAMANESICEAQVTISIAQKTKQILTGMGATVLMTREDDTFLPLADRVAICEDKNPDIYVSLHCDGADDTSSAGTHTFYFRPYSMPLAQAIHTELVHHYTTYIYTDADSNKDIVNKSIKYYPFYVTRVNNCPSVLVELGFMTNPVESTVLTDENCQYWLADAVANGIVNYFAAN